MNIWLRLPQWVSLIAFVLLSAVAMAGPDQDGDGIADSADNCRDAINADQLDTNNDGYGNACDPDLDNNGIVNFLDLELFKAAFFSTPVSPDWNPDADFDGSNAINFLDLQVMQQLFFGPPGPTGFVRWINAAGGDWNDPANWEPVGVPVAADGVLIDMPGIVITHNVGDNTCASVISQADIALSGTSQLTVNGTLDIQGMLSLTGFGTTLRNATVVRTISTDGADPLTIGDGVFLDNISLGVDAVLNNGVTLGVTNGLTLNGASLTLASTGSFTAISAIGIQTIGGTGEILFGGTTTDDNDNRIFATDGFGDVLTIGAGVTVGSSTSGGWLGTSNGIRGLVLEGTVRSNVAGRNVLVVGDPLTISGTATASAGGILEIDGNWTASVDAAFTITDGAELQLFGQWLNHGAISVTDSLLDIGSDTSDFWTNLGTIDLINSDAELGGQFVSGDVGIFATNGTVTIDGELDNTGLTFDLDTLAGTWELGNGEIIGGTIAGTTFLVRDDGALNGVTLAVDTTIANDSMSNITNGLTLENASVTIASDGDLTVLRFVGSQTLVGTGEMLFGGTATSNTINRIEAGSNSEMLTIGPDITIRPLTTGGFFGSSASGHTTILQGSVVSDMTGDVITIDGNPFVNNGLVVIDAGSVIIGTGDYLQGADGSLQVEITGTQPIEFGRMFFSGANTIAELNGMLDIVRTGFTPSLGDTFEIIDVATRGGVFSTVTGADAGDGNTFAPIYSAENVTLEVQ